MIQDPCALPHMHDSRVAFVQTPQAFPNSEGLVAVGTSESQRFEVLFRGGIFRRSGLTSDQRLQYLLTGTDYALSLAVLIFMCLPATYLLFGLSPIHADAATWLTHYATAQAACRGCPLRLTPSTWHVTTRPASRSQHKEISCLT